MNWILLRNLIISYYGRTSFQHTCGGDTKSKQLLYCNDSKGLTKFEVHSIIITHYGAMDTSENC